MAGEQQKNCSPASFVSHRQDCSVPKWHSSSRSTRRSTLQLPALQVAIAATIFFGPASTQTICQPSCGNLSIQYPWGIGYGCGDASSQGLLVCSSNGSSASELDLIMPSGKYKVQALDYSNKTIAIADPSLKSCDYTFPKKESFKLNASGPLQLSKSNKFLFLYCNANVSSLFSCSNSSALCSEYVGRCSSNVIGGTCCEHGAEPYDSVDAATLPCGSYTSVYRAVPAKNAELWSFGFQLQFVQNESRASACNLCAASQGVCGYNSTHPFICICDHSNSTTVCSLTILRSPPGPPLDCGGGACSTSERKQKSIIIGVVIATILVVGFSLLAWCCWRSRPSNRFLHPLKDISDSPIKFNYRELTEATKNFSEELGSGAYGIVYKGVLFSGGMVAVKKLAVSRQAAKVFRAEVSTLGGINHFNLVKLIGYCSEKSERLLVYEYMSNGSLDRFLFDPKTDILLDWKKRSEIALGAARGIAYLHDGSRKRIVHCDIKPANILLDESFTAKVADFGLAKHMEREQSQMDTLAIKGTPGYMAPEWLKGGAAVTEKSDVYSFGMVLLEILGGRKNADPAAQSSSHFFLPTWASEAAERNDFKAILDPRLNGNIDEEEAARFIRVSLWCIQKNPFLRPCMSDVVKMLDGTIQVSEPLPVINTHEKVGNLWGSADKKEDCYYVSGGVVDSYDKAISAR